MRLIHSFPFTAFETETGTTFRPVLHGRLRGPSGTVDAAMLLDSGADCSLLGFVTAASLGLKMSRPRRGRGASGQFPRRRSRMTVEIRYGAGWMDPITVPVDVPIRGDPPFAALGREGVFDINDVLFQLGPEPDRGMFHSVSLRSPPARRVLPTRPGLRMRALGG